jgi:hypothetical protein
MAYRKNYAWQQQPGESDRAFEAFTCYRTLEPGERSLAKVGSELVKSTTLLSRWSARWQWVERAREWDAHLDRCRLEHRIEVKKRLDEEHLKIIWGARIKAIEALAQMSPEDLASKPSELRHWLMELIHLKRLIMGEPETTDVRREKIELQATIEEYAPVFRELLDEGVIRFDDQPALLAGGDQDEGEDAKDAMLP